MLITFILLYSFAKEREMRQDKILYLDLKLIMLVWCRAVCAQRVLGI